MSSLSKKEKLENNIHEINKINRKQQIEVAAVSLGKNPKKLISIEEYRKRHPEFTKRIIL